MLSTNKTQEKSDFDYWYIIIIVILIRNFLCPTGAIPVQFSFQIQFFWWWRKPLIVQYLFKTQNWLCLAFSGWALQTNGLLSLKCWGRCGNCPLPTYYNIIFKTILKLINSLITKNKINHHLINVFKPCRGKLLLGTWNQAKSSVSLTDLDFPPFKAKN